MEVRRFEDPVAFRKSADPLLLRDEPRHNLILGVTGTLIDSPGSYPEFHLWVIEQSGVPLAAAAITPPHNVLIADPADDEALRLVVATLADSGVSVPGVVGNRPGVDLFVALWAAETGQIPVKKMSQGVFALRQVGHVPKTAGSSRPATEEDLDLILDWVAAFREEADPDVDPRGSAARVRSRLRSDPSLTGYWIRESRGTPVSLSGYSGRTPSGIRIGPVYTPAEHRGHGHATALVAEQSQWLLDQGRSYCFLYTDLANPTSNAIYSRIGYEQIAESAWFSFNPG